MGLADGSAWEKEFGTVSNSDKQTIFIVQNSCGDGSIVKVLDTEQKAKDFCDEQNKGLSKSKFFYGEYEVE